MGLFEVRELFPGSGAVLPLAADEPTLCGLTLACGSVDSDHLLV